MLTLYKYSNSICTQKVLITLDEKNLDFETVDINLFAGEQYDPEYLKINPKGVVPSLIHEGRPIIESTLICEYLDETYPDNPLIPASAYQRTQMRLWSKLIDEKLFAATREITFSCHFRHKMKTMTEEERQLRYQNVGDPERTARIKSTYKQGVESPYVYQAIADWEKAVKQMEATLAEGGPWLVNGEFSLGDINMIPFLWRLEYLNLLDLWLAERPKVNEWWALAKTRPSALRAIPDSLTEQELDNMWKYGSGIRDDIAKRREEYIAEYNV